MSDQTQFGEWDCRQLTHGSADGIHHQHSYYDIPVFDSESKRLAVTRFDFTGRDVTPDDRITVGYVSLESGEFTKLADSSAFSLQQGPMAQWVPGKPCMIWSDRENGNIVSRMHNVETGETVTFPRMAYAVSPDGRWALSLNMDRLDGLRPGYGYAGGQDDLADQAPGDDGVWRLDLETGDSRLILSLKDAHRIFMKTRSLKDRFRFWKKPAFFWFNHTKISPDGKRFTVKLRWRRKGKSWNDRQGVSLTVSADGSDVRILAPATSHVIWEDAQHLYYYSALNGAAGVRRIVDSQKGGEVLGPIGEGVIDGNVHIRKLPGSDRIFVFDTPYQPQVDLKLLDEESNSTKLLASFSGHEPPRGPYRCDLHPCPSPDGNHIVVTSPQDGARQVYLLSRK